MGNLLGALLRRTEQVTKTDVRYVARGSFWLGLTQVTSALVGLGMTVAYANLLPPAALGTFKYILSAYTLLAIFGLPGMDTAVLQSVSGGHTGALAQAFKLKVRWSLLATAAAGCYSAYLAFTGQGELAVAVGLLGISLPLMEASALYSSLLNGRQLFKPWAIADIVNQVATSLAVVAAMLLSSSIVAITATYCVATCAARLATYAWARRRYAPSNEPDPKLLSYGVAVSAFNIMSRVTSSIDQVVLFNFLGPAQVAMFSLANAVPSRIQSLLRIGGSLAFPKVAQRSFGDLSKSLPRKTLIMGIGIAAIVLLYVLLSPFVFATIFPQYLPALRYSQVLALYNLGAVTYPISAAFFAHKRVKINYVLSIAALGIKGLALALLVKPLGLWAPVIGTIGAAASTVVLCYSYLFSVARRERLGQAPSSGTA